MHINSWLWLTLISGVLLGFYDIFKKKSLEKVPLLNVLALYSLFSFLLVAYDYESALNIDKKSIALILLKSSIIFLSWIMGFAAIKHLPISIISPFGTLSPIFTMALGIMVLGEKIDLVQGIGIVAILISYYFISMTGKAEVKGLFRNKYLYLMAGSGLLSAVSALMDKIILKRVETGQMQFWFCLFLFIMYTLAFILKNAVSRTSAPFRFSFYILLTSIFIVLSDRIYFTAVHMHGSEISLILPLRKTSIFVSAIIGGLIFREKNLKKKFACIVILLIGILIVFRGQVMLDIVNGLIRKLI